MALPNLFFNSQPNYINYAKTPVTWTTMIWGIGMVTWFINFMMTLIKIFNRFFKNRKDKNV